MFNRILKRLVIFLIIFSLAGGVFAYALISQSMPQENLALNKPVQCNPSADRFPGGLYTGTADPQYAVNGIKGNVGQVWSTWPEDSINSGQGDRWLVIDLGDEYDLTGYKIYHAGQFTSVSDNTRDFQILAQTDPAYDFVGDPDGGTWATIDTVTGNTANSTEKDISNVAAAERVRYVRLSIIKCWSGDLATTNTGATRIQEVEIYGEPRVPTNIAIGKDVKSNAGTTPELAVDGISDAQASRWLAAAAHPGDPTSGKWLVVDLGGDYDLTGYKVFHASPFEGAWAQGGVGNTRDFKLRAQTEEIYDFENNPGGGTWTDIDLVIENLADITVRDISAQPSATKVRYVRLYITDCQLSSTYRAVRIQELELYGLPH